MVGCGEIIAPFPGVIYNKKVEEPMFAVKFPVSTMKKSFFSTASLLAIVLMLMLTACAGGTQAASSTTSSGCNAQQYDLALRPGSGLTVSLFAAGTSGTSAPDPVVCGCNRVLI